MLRRTHRISRTTDKDVALQISFIRFSLQDPNPLIQFVELHHNGPNISILCLLQFDKIDFVDVDGNEIHVGAHRADALLHQRVDAERHALPVDAAVRLGTPSPDSYNEITKATVIKRSNGAVSKNLTKYTLPVSNLYGSMRASKSMSNLNGKATTNGITPDLRPEVNRQCSQKSTSSSRCSERRSSVSSMDDATNYHATQYLVFSVKDRSQKPILIQFPNDVIFDYDANDYNSGATECLEKDVWGSDTSLEEEAEMATTITGAFVERDLTAHIARHDPDSDLDEELAPYNKIQSESLSTKTLHTSINETLLMSI